MTVQDLNLLFGQNLRKYRLLNGWTQNVLAEKIDLSPNFISDMENGRKFASPENLINFAEVFNINVYELFKPENILSGDTASTLLHYTKEVQGAIKNIQRQYLDALKRS
jgi:transcriptional regulator with XRE-family HTH domain